MKLSVFTTISNPTKRGDNWLDAINCYKDLADEVFIVDGGVPSNNSVDYGYLFHPWPKEFSWEFIGQQFQRVYEACTGDWVIHADIDMLFHENDFQAIRQTCIDNWEAPALSFYKHQFILPDRYNLKSRLVIAANKGKYGDRIKFDSGGDLCQPSLDGEELKPDMVPEAKVPIYNYECLLKTKEQLLEDKGRMARAWQRHFGEYKLGGPDDQSAYDEWYKMVAGRFAKPHRQVALNTHPKYVQETIKHLKPEHWGYNGFGLVERNNYA